VKNKRIAVFALLLALTLTLTPISPFNHAYAAETIVVTETPQNIYVDDVYRSIAGFNIDGSNYFKLRDLAVALSGTVVEFDVLWSEEDRLIELVKSVAYSGGEEANVPIGGTIQIRANEADLLISGMGVVTQNAYNINDNNYFKLRDIAPYIGFGISYVEATNSVYLRSDGLNDVAPSPEIEQKSNLDIFYDYLYQDTSKFALEINIQQYGIKTDKLETMYYSFLERYPELFFLGNGVGWSYSSDRVFSIKPIYIEPIETIAEQIPKFNARFEQAIADIDASLATSSAGATPRNIVIAVNDWLCTHCEYAYNEWGDPDPIKSSAYDAIVEGSAVCDGYAKAFTLFMNYYGVTNRKLESEIIAHAWNQVLIDGEWFHVDVTWNDPTWEGGPRPDYAGREYLMVTDEGLAMADAKGGKTDADRHQDWEYYERLEN
jgi:transglutaminase-like putative cysteine protease